VRGECPSPQEQCPYYATDGGCFSDSHHIYFPKNQYCDIMSSEFRELPENKQQLCRLEHEELHAEVIEPEKPDRETMRDAIRTAWQIGAIALSKNKRKKLNIFK
jgi:hypothetical protein